MWILFVQCETDELLKYLFRVPSQGDVEEDWSTVVDSGWRKYGPRRLYNYITDFLRQMQRLVNESDDSAPISQGNLDHAPFSLNEFHHFLAQQYGKVLTSGDSTQTPVVYHTTHSKRNRNIGWYHSFEYDSSPMETIPDPSQNQPEVVQGTKPPPDRFWCDICSTDTDGYHMSIGHILVGKLVLTHFPQLVGRQGSISAREIRELHKTRISNEHTLEYLFPDARRFATFVKNCLSKTLKWRLHPFEPSDASENQKLQHKYEVCSKFQIECTPGGLDPELAGAIQSALNERKLKNILSVGWQGVNTECIFFLHGLHIFYQQECAGLCERNEGMSSQKAASELQKLWGSENYVLNDSI